MQKQLQNNLVLRSISEGHTSDKEQLPAFFENVFEDSRVSPWSQNLLDNHPTVTHDDIWVVVDTSQNDKIASSLVLIPQTWRCEDIEFPVGRVELVATDKEYRRKGLVRELMNALHERSDELGHLAQVITGIPNFYRQFGYAMTVELGVRNVVPFPAIPKLKEDETPQYTLRLATTEDIPILAACDTYSAKNYLLTTVCPENIWHYMLHDVNENSLADVSILCIVDVNNNVIGYVVLSKMGDDNNLIDCLGYVVGEKASYLATYEDILRGIQKYTQETYPDYSVGAVGFDTGILDVVDKMVNRTFPATVWNYPYAWYMRVPDLARFIQKIAPILERRLQGSGANNFTGDLNIDFYKPEGLCLHFEQGKLTKAENKKVQNRDCAFVDLTFYHMLFGYRDYEELRHMYPDTLVNRKARVLLDILFPKKRSWLMALN